MTDLSLAKSAATPKFAIYILGAGFSRPAGLPLGNDLWSEVLRRGLCMEGRASKFRKDLDHYIKFRSRCEGKSVSAEDINFEEFLGFLDLEHYLGLRGSDTWSQDGNEGQIVTKTLIGQILIEKTPATQNVPKLYLDFVRLLRPGDRVLTFNYDVLLERALEAVKVPYRLFPHRYESVGKWGACSSPATLSMDNNEVVVLKMHGSVDWFDRQPLLDRQQDAHEQGFHWYDPEDPVFNSARKLTAIPITEGPRFADDPLREMHRVVDIDRLYRDPPWFLSVPSIVAPSINKVIYSGRISEFWRGLNEAGTGSLRLVIIGYSLPPHDDYVRQILYRLVRNYQHIPIDRVRSDAQEREDLLIVDLQQTANDLKEFKKRYAFIDWDKTTLHPTGFDDEALRHLAAYPDR